MVRRRNVSRNVVRNGTRLRVATIVGARPQFIKAAVISRAIASWNASRPGRVVEDILIHTGQHYDPDMSRVFFDQLDLPAPRVHLGVGPAPAGRQTAAMLDRLDSVLRDLKPDVVLVHGDTNSTLAGALAAAKLRIPLAHGEAGLRSRNRRMPEEINRIVTDHVAWLLFCPTGTAVRNLKSEGLADGVRLVGDVMYDAYRHYRKTALETSHILAALNVRPNRYALATVHRQETVDEPNALGRVFAALADIANRFYPVVCPLHPRTRRALAGLRPRPAAHPALILTDPLPYFDSLVLTSRALAVITDSGGLQKEAFFAGVPCVTLREETEWPETLAGRCNTLSGTDPQRIERAFGRAVSRKRFRPRPLFGRGNAGFRTVQRLVQGWEGR